MILLMLAQSSTGVSAYCRMCLLKSYFNHVGNNEYTLEQIKLLNIKKVNKMHLLW
ncbi:rCG53342, partial [Rattus norvegicus]